MTDRILDILLDSLLDTLLVLPFLLCLHILIEVYEYKAGSKLKVNKLLNGNFAPLLGGGVGLIPQCGFSVVATKLYCRKNIALGTLLAVYIATSDEAIPILISTPSSAIKLVPLLIIKFVFALSVGYAVNFIMRKKEKLVQPVMDTATECGCHGHEIGVSDEEKEKMKAFDWQRFVWHPIIHTLTICLYIFIVNLVLNSVIEFMGEDKLFSALNQAVWAQPFIAALVGLIPNCASSVVITQMYALGGSAYGGLSLGATVAGLSVNAGIALAVLFKENKNLKQNIKIVGLLYFLSVSVGLIITAVTQALGI